jgi:hypothetical protein
VIKVAFSVKREYKDVTEQRIAARIGQLGGLQKLEFSGDRGGESAEDKILQRSGTP